MVFFSCYLAVLWPTLEHSPGDSLTDMMLITAFKQFRPVHREPCNKVESLSQAKYIVGLEVN